MNLAQPFLRWAGSKRRHLPQILPTAPATYGTYFEPFLGGGTVFFGLSPDRAILGDSIGDLIRTYKGVRSNPSLVHRYIEKWSVDRDSYYQVRDRQLDNQSEFAAQFIYLNKTCWNGLYRVNKDGKFNVPFGKPKTSLIVHEERLVACASALNKAEILHADYRDTLQLVQRGDLVFLDPPYVTAKTSNTFVDYNDVLFTWEDQVLLRETVENLQSIGATIIMTNADHPSIRELYSNFMIKTLQFQSTLASSAAHRRPVTELLITTGPAE